MDRASAVATIRNKYGMLSSAFDEKTRRLWAASEAKSAGWGGISLVSEATGLAHTTIRRGVHDLDGLTTSPEKILGSHKIRRAGAGRKNLVETNPRICEALESLIEPDTRGDPESALKWTCKSTRRLARELLRQGYSIGPTSVRTLLHQLDYSLQANRKTREGIDNPDRNAQFLYINENVKKFLRSRQPAISVDAKKKELVGDFSNSGREYRKKRSPVETRMHDFPDKELGKALPYGIYDIESNEGWITVGIDHDTARFAANSILRWWTEMGQNRFPRATRLLITADAGGSNGWRTRLWKVALQELANEIEMNVTVCHFPPGTSKWNKIEHRLFSFITQNWRGKPLYNLQTIVNLISHTTTEAGLVVKSAIDDTPYETGIKVSDNELAAVSIKPHEFHGEWNYTITKQRK
jgi:hypothetical protein